jgi:hypothetical protein
MSGFFSYADVWWVQWATIFCIGCVSGLWVDSLLRKLPSLNTSVTPLDFKRNAIFKSGNGAYKRSQACLFEVASHSRFKIDGSISSQSTGNFFSSTFTSPCKDKLFVIILFNEPIKNPAVHVYSTRPNLAWRDMGICSQCLLLEVTGDIGFAEIAIDAFPTSEGKAQQEPMVGKSYAVDWLPELDGWLDNPKVRHAYRLQTLDKKHR